MQGSDAHFEAKGSVAIGGKTIPYQVVSESYGLCTPEDSLEATIFSFTYLRSDLPTSEINTRPVIFAFNGGPGSSSVWLHLGLLGPTRVKMDTPVKPPSTPPFDLENNPHCPLDVADVVMIDPVGTGFARLIDQSAVEKYLGIDEDAQAIAKFIEHWLTKYDRWNAPKHIMGESYGTARCGALVSALMGGPFTMPGRLSGIPVDGVIMMGSVNLNGMTPEPVEQSVINLPSFAATRWHYRPEHMELSDFIDEAYTFAQDEYLRALFMGNRMGNDEQKRVVAKLAYYSGLPESYLLRNNLRVSTRQFIFKILEDNGLDVGLYDSRYTVPHRDLGDTYDTVADDGAMGLYTSAFVGAMNGAKRKELGISSSLDYGTIMFKDINARWKFRSKRTPLQSLEAAMRRNSNMRVFLISGCFDLCTPMGYVRLVLSQGRLPMDRVTVREYESGHMPYLGEQSAVRLADDLRNFILKKK